MLRIAVFILAVIPSLAMADCRTEAHKYRAQITREAQFRFGIPAPVPVIIAQMRQESDCNPLAVSRTGAAGLMQFMPATAQWTATAGAFGTVDPTNPAWAIRAGVWYDRWIYDRIRNAETDCDRWHFTLSSYNGGLGYVYKRQKLSTRAGSWDYTGNINPGILPSNQHENQTYSVKILMKHQPLFKDWGRTVCLP
jgi:soluble lytic murein transglycosylase-like protein